MKKSILSVVITTIVYSVSVAGDVSVPPYPEKGLKGMVTPERLPTTDNLTIELGAQVWAGTCKVCHGGGLAGAPKITGTKFWSQRLEQGLDVLIDHATNGFQSKSGGYMPARGGNNDLTDEEVEAAVRFMIYHSGGQSLALNNLNK